MDRLILANKMCKVSAVYFEGGGNQSDDSIFLPLGWSFYQMIDAGFPVE